eukprot:scaffold4079_cov167-Amphora_coffeaeformis.AAC.20
MRGLFNFDWDFAPVDGYPTISFNGTEGRDMEFRYNYTGNLGSENAYIKYLSFDLLEYDCERKKKVNPSVIALTEATGQSLYRVVESSNEDNEVILFLGIDRETIVESPYYMDGPDGLTGTIQFCVRGDYEYDEDADPATTDESINFHETQVTITVDLTAGFELVAINVIRDGADEASANLQCRVQAYFCTDDRRRIPPPYLAQGSPLQFCVEIADEDRGRFWLRDIVRTDLDQDNDPTAYRALDDEYDNIIVDFDPDPFTEKSCISGICRIKTQLKSKYFVERYPSPLDIFGTGLCALGSAMEGQTGIDIPLVGARTSIQAMNGFLCGNSTMFTLNGLDDIEYPKMLSFDEDANDCFLRLTPDTAGMRASSAFVPFEFIDLNAGKTFSMNAGYRIYGNDVGSADGMAFVIHQDPRQANAIGGSGGSLGSYVRGDQEGIKSAIVIEWDTHLNREFFDDGENRLQIMYVDENGNMLELAESGLLPIRTSADGSTTGRIWIEYCNDKVLRVYLNSNGNKKPSSPQLFAYVDFNDLFSDDTVFVGFTAGTFSLGDNHDILDWTVTQLYDQCDLIPNIARDTTIVAEAFSEIDNPDGFPCDTLPFYINRGTNPVDMVFPSYVQYDSDLNSCFLRMTPDGVAPRAASAFLNFAFDPDNTDKVFSMNIGYRIFGEDAGSADGMAFVMHQDPRGVYAIGEPGGAIGVYATEYDREGATPPIAPAIVIEWDTFHNKEYLDDGEDRIHIVLVSKNGTMTELAETGPLAIRSDASGTPGRMWVDYCSDGILQVYINTNGNTKPEEPQATATVNLSEHFEGNGVVVGYTAGTWAQADYQDILDWQFSQTSLSCPSVSDSI